mmetsp:Transcript_15670/g.35896  ORF Transcript_15670/g.35896 Transcript_15670/m.35896 type:complete len:207 (-) Transcript_15670:194-814(-)
MEILPQPQIPSPSLSSCSCASPCSSLAVHLLRLLESPPPGCPLATDEQEQDPSSPPPHPPLLCLLPSMPEISPPSQAPWTGSWSTQPQHFASAVRLPLVPSMQKEAGHSRSLHERRSSPDNWRRGPPMDRLRAPTRQRTCPRRSEHSDQGRPGRGRRKIQPLQALPVLACLEANRRKSAVDSTHISSRLLAPAPLVHQQQTRRTSP